MWIERESVLMQMCDRESLQIVENGRRQFSASEIVCTQCARSRCSPSSLLPKTDSQILCKPAWPNF